MSEELDWVYVLRNGDGGRIRVFSDFKSLCNFIIKQCNKDNYTDEIIDRLVKDEAQNEKYVAYIRSVFQGFNEMTFSHFFKKERENAYRFIYDEDIFIEYLEIE
jgi:hypothetical protein